jgi:GNAT superfamily N-acetyltransferase
VQFVPAFRQDIYRKYAQRAEASGGYAMMREAAPEDQDEVQKYNKFVQAHELCKRVWLDRFGSQAQRLEAMPGYIIAMGINEQGAVVVCALIEIITGHPVGTVGKPIDDKIQVALISNLATSSSEEGRGHAWQLLTKIKEFAKKQGCSACALGVDVYDARVSKAELQERAQQQTLRVLCLYYRAGFRYQLQWQKKRGELNYLPAQNDPSFIFSNRHPRTGYIMVCWLIDGAPAERYRLKEIDGERLLHDVNKNYALTWREEPTPWRK